MRKILKTRGSLNQWIDLVTISIEQMGLSVEICGNIILALHNGLQVMKFQLSENDGVILDIDYFDDRDLEDFKKLAAQIITNPDSYRNTLKQQQTPESPLKSEIHLNNNYTQPNINTMVEKQNKFTSNKGFRIALIIVGIFVLLAVAGFGGYKLYHIKTAPKQKLADAMIAYGKGDYGTAISIADALILEYPNSSQATDAQKLIDNANAEIKNIENQKVIDAQKADAQAHLRITTATLVGPDENGEASILLDYTNTYKSGLVAVTFGITFTDANGNSLVVDDEESTIVTCIDFPYLSQGESRDIEEPQFGPYHNNNIARFSIVSVTAEYYDGTTLNLTTPEQVAWILPQ